jgi:raffinose/stachyose/melibiose transport system substrate-binding protein
MWDSYVAGVENQLFVNLVAEITQKYPNIKIERNLLTHEQEQQTIKPALTSKTGPDLIYYQPGPAYINVLAKAGLLLPLDKYADQYGWKKEIPAWIYNQGMFRGRFYGIASRVFFQGVYYNKKVFSDLGLKPPNSYADFLNICQTAKSKGFIPVTMNDKDQWPGFHHAAIFINAGTGRKKVEEILSGQSGWNVPEIARSLDLIKELVAKGYTTPDPNSIGFEDGNKEFYSGKSAMLLGGSWIASNIVDAIGDGKVGFFPLPPISAGMDMEPAGGLGDCMVVSSATKYPDECAIVMNEIFSDSNTKYWYQASILPTYSSLDVSTLNLSYTFKMIAEIAEKPMGYNLDTILGPKCNQAIKDGVQELIAGKTTGAAVAAEMQNGHEADVRDGLFENWLLK